MWCYASIILVSVPFTTVYLEHSHIPITENDAFLMHSSMCYLLCSKPTWLGVSNLYAAKLSSNYLKEQPDVHGMFTAFTCQAVLKEASVRIEPILCQVILDRDILFIVLLADSLHVRVYI